ncbi:DUF488 family protein [Metallibacterium scheffleri]|uniref:DUF488 family protein, N3 subclade n=1 Tax=Metallibacterium scheffleri TaxID=993689 RepID=UPI0023F54FA2|nr:DUF488 family protein [Metallibacterium scheffleri]
MNRKVSENHRTLIRQGGTYMVSIPKNYLIDLGWKSGDRILVERRDKSVFLNKVEEPQIFSVGYGGKKKDDFIELLKGNKVSELVDVRNHAFSWNKDFSMKNLSESLADAGIRYINLPRLGAPKNIRVEIKENQDPDKFFIEYSAWLKSNASYFDLLDVLARQKVTAMMCLEEDYRNCHRKILGERLQERGYEVIQL